MTPDTIVIADDHAETRRVLKELCEVDGWTVIEARDGREAVARTKEHRPDAVLTDLSMPGLDGLEGARRLRRHPHFQDTVIIAVTGLTLSAKQEIALRSIFDAVVPKPVRPATLRRRLARALGRRPRRSFNSAAADTRSMDPGA